MTDSLEKRTTSELAKTGEERIAWIRSRMAMLARKRKEFDETKPFTGHAIGMSLHLEPKTAVLLETLAAGGAKIVATGNHGSTQDDMVAALRKQGMTVYGSRADSLEQHHRNLAAVLDANPDILLDNGADLAAGSRHEAPPIPLSAAPKKPLPAASAFVTSCSTVCPSR